MSPFLTRSALNPRQTSGSAWTGLLLPGEEVLLSCHFERLQSQEPHFQFHLRLWGKQETSIGKRKPVGSPSRSLPHADLWFSSFYAWTSVHHSLPPSVTMRAEVPQAFTYCPQQLTWPLNCFVPSSLRGPSVGSAPLQSCSDVSGIHPYIIYESLKKNPWCSLVGVSSYINSAFRILKSGLLDWNPYSQSFLFCSPP